MLRPYSVDSKGGLIIKTSL